MEDWKENFTSCRIPLLVYRFSSEMYLSASSSANLPRVPLYSTSLHSILFQPRLQAVTQLRYFTLSIWGRSRAQAAFCFGISWGATTDAAKLH